MTQQSDNSTTVALGKLFLTCEQLKINSVVFQLDWLSDPKLLILADMFPVTGPFIWQAVAFQIAKEGGYLRPNLLRSTAKLTGVPFAEVQKIVDACCSDEVGLFLKTENGYTSKRVQREIEKTARQRFANKRDQRELIFPWDDQNHDLPPSSTQAPARVDPSRGGASSPLSMSMSTSESTSTSTSAEEGGVGGGASPLYPGCLNTHLSDYSLETLQSKFLQAGLDLETLDSAIRGYDSWKSRKIASGQGGWASVADDLNSLCAPWVIAGAVKFKTEMVRLKNANGNGQKQKLDWDKVWERNSESARV